MIVLTIIHDSTGMNQDCKRDCHSHVLTAYQLSSDNIDDEFKTPRGIRGYTLHLNNGSDFKEWRVAGSKCAV